MYRILVFGMTENPGGVESVIMNYYRHMDGAKFQFDFLCNFHEKAAYEDELVSAGSNVFHITARRDSRVVYWRELKHFFESCRSKYQAIWVNICSLANIDYLFMAKKYGIGRRIVHSHNSQNMDSWLRGILHAINRKRIGRCATDFWACSQASAEWFYEKALLSRVKIVPNAISVEKMFYDKKKGVQYREMLGWGDKYVIGHIGRFHFQKNQKFVLEVFKYVLEQLPDARLILIGQGEDAEMLLNYAECLELGDRIKFVGVQEDIAGWLSAMDLFLFPSRFEGLPLAVLEAQANGVAALVSENVIPEEVAVNENFQFFDLDLGARAWAGQVIQLKETGKRIVDIGQIKENFAAKGYEIERAVNQLENMFLGRKR